MEQLSLLQKIYLYGETLSSEELNQIVLYLNSSIEAINALIAKNNNINEGHCEMRYKVSAQLPEAPESGTDGKSNGWSDAYTKPDTANGEITWMTLSFFNGEGVYGDWSTPVCITWGSVRGQVGPKGESGVRGSFKSRVFKRLNTIPDTPTGGTYDNPIPSEGGWTDGIPTGKEIIWSSVCTFYGNGLSSGWTVPAAESDNDTLDIEFSPNAVQPQPPTGDTPFTNHESEGWYDPSSNQFNLAGTMVWRAERKVSNGVYNGDWTITRIVGEKGERGESGLTGGHYEFRYNNFKPSEQASAPTKPETGSNGTTNGWTTSQETLTETLIKDGYATWMTQCYQNENGTYGAWTDPIRITGANGYDGADGNEIEFVYTRNNTGETPAAPPTTLQEDWTGTVNGVTWTDNPLGVLEDMMYEYVSLRAKINDVWSDYSTPVIWSKWGEKGMDGDGIEYIFKAFAKQQTWGASDATTSSTVLGGNDNPANWAASTSSEYLGPEGYEWSDDPVNIDSTTNKYEYVSIRRFKLWPNETQKRWGTFETPKLWARYADKGDTGGHYEFRYCNYTPSTNHETPTKPSDNSNGIGTYGTGVDASTWAREVLDPDVNNGEYTYMSQCYVTPGTPNNIYDTWTDPVRITGALGERGADGSDIEFIYTRKSTIWNNPTAPTTSDDATIAQDDWPNIDGSTPSKIVNGTTWYDSPLGVDGSGNKYEYMCVRYKYSGTSTWTAYSPPVIWSAFGETGMDGDGYEYIFKHFQNQQTWANSSTNTDAANNIQGKDDNPANWSTSLSGFQNREFYGPSGHTWSDDPQGISPNHLYEYVSTREYKLWPGETKKRWGTFSTPTLWSNFAKASDGGNYEFRYTNTSNSNPTKPTTGSDGIGSVGSGANAVTWSRTPATLSSSDIKGGIFTYMTYGFKFSNGTYGEWSTPIRITGANGEDGADGSDIEFLYARTKTSTAPTKPSKPSSGDGSYTYNGVTRTWKDEDWGVGKSTSVAATDGDTTWSDNPRGVTNEIKYEWVIVRTKPAGKNTSFEDFSPPTIWSKWGEKGMDGDGMLYVFKLFSSELTDAQCTSNIPTKPATMTNNEWIPSGWSDDPISPTSTDPFCYCSVIKKINGTWGNFEKLSLWAKYAKDSNVAGPDGKGITYIITRDTYSESNWSTYCAIDHSESFNRGSSDLGSSCRAGDFFIVKGTATDGQYKFHLATFKCTAFDNSNITGTCISHIKDGDKGLSITGKTGPMFYIAGIWDSTKTYTKNDYKCPVVFYDDGTNERYYYLIASSSKNLNPSSNSSVWGLADNFEAIFTKVLFSNFAKLGSFVINQDWMISQHGVEYDSSGNLTVVSGDNTTNYQNFKTSSPTENLSGEVNFCPNLAIDAKTGKVYAQRMEIGGSSVFKGTVYASDGSFTGTVYANDGSFSGEINASSGTISGNMTITSTLSVSGSIIIGPSNKTHFILELYNSYGENAGRICGYIGDAMLYSLYFNSSSNPIMQLLSNDSTKALDLEPRGIKLNHDGEISALLGNGLSITQSFTSSGTKYQTTANFTVNTNTGNIDIYSTRWPTTGSTGHVYKDSNGFLKVG